MSATADDVSAARKAIATSGWFGTLPPAVRHVLLRAMSVRRYAHVEPIFGRGERADAWLACGAGACGFPNPLPPVAR